MPAVHATSKWNIHNGEPSYSLHFCLGGRLHVLLDALPPQGLHSNRQLGENFQNRMDDLTKGEKRPNGTIKNRSATV